MSYLYKYKINTTGPEEFIDITKIVNDSVSKSEVKEGEVCVFCPHTTAGITINENADPDVVRDILKTLDRIIPVNGDYMHVEGNSHAHIKASLMGSSCSVIIHDGKIVLGTWQGIYFTEFDGPRTRNFYVKVF